MLLPLALEKKLLFFGGKGGVGKTTLSAASALAAAEQGRKVLLVSTDPAHSLGHLFATTVGPQITPLHDRLDCLELDPAQTVERHLVEVTQVLQRLMPAHLSDEVTKHMALSRHAPGMHEAAMLERIAEVATLTADYDLVVFDTAPSGHTARLMALPELMATWTEGLLKRRDKADSFTEKLKALGGRNDTAEKLFGEPPANNINGNNTSRETQIRQLLNRRQQRFSQLRDNLANPQTTGFVIVLTAERLPVLETIELYRQLRRTGLTVSGLAINKRLPPESGEFLARRRQQEQDYLLQLTDELPHLPRQDLLLMAEDIVGVPGLKKLASYLSAN